MDEQDKCEQCAARGQHTPEPWYVRGDAAYGTLCVVDSSSEYIVDRFVLGERTIDERRANAHLIAAAPTLLAACEEVLDRLPPGELAAVVSAAILKAKPL